MQIANDFWFLRLKCHFIHSVGSAAGYCATPSDVSVSLSICRQCDLADENVRTMKYAYVMDAWYARYAWSRNLLTSSKHICISIIYPIHSMDHAQCSLTHSAVQIRRRCQHTIVSAYSIRDELHACAYLSHWVGQQFTVETVQKLIAVTITGLDESRWAIRLREQVMATEIHSAW